MLRLVKANLRFNAAWLTGITILLVLWQFAVSHPRRFGPGFSAGFSIGFLMSLMYFIRDAYYKAEVLYRALPVDRRDLVSAKYATSAILFFGPPLYGLVFWDLLIFFVSGHHSSGFQLDVGYTVGHSLIARMVLWWLVLSAFLPIALRWGSLSRVATLWILLAIISPVYLHSVLVVSRAGSMRFSMNVWILIVIFTMLTIGLLSFELSVWLCRHKES